MQSKIEKYMDENYMGIEELMKKVGLDVSTYFNFKKRKRISFYSLRKFADIGIKL
jgi:hypothetical protein